MAAEQIPMTQIPQEEEGMSLMGHLVELRNRLMKAGLGVILGMGVGAFLVLGPPDVFSWVVKSLLGDIARPDSVVKLLQTTSATELFTTTMTLALTIGVIIAMPVIVYQLIAFIAPALLPKEKRYVFTALPFITLFFLAGVSFGWFITVPAALRFLFTFPVGAQYVQIQPPRRTLSAS